MSRDILMEAILKWEQAGRRVALHVHDEIVTLAPKVCAEQVKTDLIEVMTELPVWAAGLPMDAEGTISEHYTK
jgi:DNA polymerase I-like protein with 3'-5' exonuclease and polymerase domains